MTEGKIYQAFNKKNKAWVKYRFTKAKGFQATDVKQINPKVKFKGIPVRGGSRRKWKEV